MYYLYATLFTLLLFGCWWITALGFPGNWLIVILTALFAYALPFGAQHSIGWQVMAFLIGLAVIGEVLEFISSASGVAKGGTKKGALYAMIGSLIGGFFGAAVGSPIPLIGPLIGVTLLSSVGAMGGALIGELHGGQSVDKSLTIGKAAFWGRLFGSLAKIVIGLIMIALAAGAAFI